MQGEKACAPSDWTGLPCLKLFVRGASAGWTGVQAWGHCSLTPADDGWRKIACSHQLV